MLAWAFARSFASGSGLSSSVLVGCTVQSESSGTATPAGGTGGSGGSSSSSGSGNSGQPMLVDVDPEPDDEREPRRGRRRLHAVPDGRSLEHLVDLRHQQDQPALRLRRDRDGDRRGRRSTTRPASRSSADDTLTQASTQQIEVHDGHDDRGPGRDVRHGRSRGDDAGHHARREAERRPRTRSYLFFVQDGADQRRLPGDADRSADARADVAVGCDRARLQPRRPAPTPRLARDNHQPSPTGV